MANWIEMVALDLNNKRCHVFEAWIRLIQNECESYTSSTAQGGGGSFKHRKPIGEIGCCESEMAERSH